MARKVSVKVETVFMFDRFNRLTLILLIPLFMVVGSAAMTRPVESASVGQFSGTPAGKEAAVAALSPFWAPGIQRWSGQIEQVANAHGIDPDFVAAVIAAESDGIPDGVSRVGAVGLMGVMPSGPGMEWRPQPDELVDPGVNLRWGVAILTDIIRQSGGDLSAALAAYAGGWREANKGVPRRYAASVLDDYSRAVLIRNDIDPVVASQWTLAVEMNHGYVPTDPLLVLGEQPLSGLHTYAPHTLYDFMTQDGSRYRIKAYVVPVALVVAAPEPTLFGSSDGIDPNLEVRMGLATVKEIVPKGKSPRVILACLPTVDRLRGTQSTRWFAPSSCPDWTR